MFHVAEIDSDDRLRVYEVYERWVRKFERQRLGLLHDLKRQLEGDST